MKLLKDNQKKRKGRARKGEGSLRMRGQTWWYRIPNPVPGGPPLEGSCNTPDIQQAILEKNKALAASREPRSPNRVTPTTITELAEAYFDEKEEEAEHREKADPDCHAARNLRIIRFRIAKMTRRIGHIRADDLTTDDIKSYREAREKEGNCFSSVNHDLRYLKAILRRGMRQTPPLVSRVPFIRLPSEKSQVRDGFIERDDYHRILAKLPPSLKLLHVCGFHTGARSGELKRIRWDMINWDRNIIQIRPRTAKNKQGRYLPIWGDMRQALVEQQEIRNRDFPNCEWVFFWHDSRFRGERISRFDAPYKIAVEAAGLSGVIFHDLRRSAIKYGIQEAGIDSTTIRKMSGHKTDTMLTRYNIGSEREMENLGRDLDQSLRRSHKVIRMKRA